jgi:hypothetical protein
MSLSIARLLQNGSKYRVKAKPWTAKNGASAIGSSAARRRIQLASACIATKGIIQAEHGFTGVAVARVAVHKWP